MQTTIANRSKPNVGQSERTASLIGGSALILLALSRRSRLSLPIIFGGGYLLFRGISGKDYVYEALGINRAGPNGQEGIEVERTMTVNRPRPEVYAFWRDFELLPSFMKHLESVKVIEDGRSHWLARGPFGMQVEWVAETVEDNPNERIAWHSLPGSDVENSGIVQFKDAPGGRGTEVRVRLTYHPPAGSASAAVAKLFGEEPSRQVLEDLRRFKQMIETGETATIDGQTSGRVAQVEKERVAIKGKRDKDIVQKTSEDSFPASDPPAWTGSE